MLYTNIGKGIVISLKPVCRFAASSLEDLIWRMKPLCRFAASPLGGFDMANKTPLPLCGISPGRI